MQYGQQMEQFDGRGLAVGIAGGVLVGLVINFFTGSAFWVGLLAAIGAMIGMNAGWFGDDDNTGS